MWSPTAQIEKLRPALARPFSLAFPAISPEGHSAQTPSCCSPLPSPQGGQPAPLCFPQPGQAVPPLSPQRPLLKTWGPLASRSRTCLLLCSWGHAETPASMGANLMRTEVPVGMAFRNGWKQGLCPSDVRKQSLKAIDSAPWPDFIMAFAGFAEPNHLYQHVVLNHFLRRNGSRQAIPPRPGSLQTPTPQVSLPPRRLHLEELSTNRQGVMSASVH